MKLFFIGNMTSVCQVTFVVHGYICKLSMWANISNIVVYALCSIGCFYQIYDVTSKYLNYGVGNDLMIKIPRIMKAPGKNLP